MPTDDQVGVAVGTLKLLADSTRLRLVWALLDGEDSVNRLAERVGAQPAAVSQHLAKLRLGQLVQTRRQGTQIFYLAKSGHLRALVEQALFHADHVAHDLPQHAEARQSRPAKRGKTA